MTLIQVWGCLLIFVVCPLLGGLPLATWLTRGLNQPQYASNLFGTPINGRRVILVGVEASKGVLSVLLARYYFPADPTWWIIALIALVFGQFWLRHSKQILGVVAGGVVYSWQVAFLLLLMGGDWHHPLARAAFRTAGNPSAISDRGGANFSAKFPSYGRHGIKFFTGLGGMNNFLTQNRQPLLIRGLVHW